MPESEETRPGGDGRTHVLFINSLSWAELYNHLTSAAGHDVPERTMERLERYDVFVRRSRAEAMHADLHLDFDG